MYLGIIYIDELQKKEQPTGNRTFRIGAKLIFVFIWGFKIPRVFHFDNAKSTRFARFDFLLGLRTSSKLKE
jgi:hypothetical protein